MISKGCRFLLAITLLAIALTGIGGLPFTTLPAKAQAPNSCAAKFQGNLIGYWSFDDPQDPMKPTYGTLRGNPIGTPPLTTGVVGQALVFNGDSYVNYGTGLDIPAWHSYTVSIWFLNDGRVAPTDGYGQKIIDKTTWFSDFFLGVQNSPEQTTPRPLIFMYDRDFKNIATTGYSYVDSQWHHAVILKRGTHGELWIDGKLIGEKNDLLPTVNDQPLLLGYSLAADSYQQQYWGGYLDEFAVFKVDLTSQEILDLYKTSAAGQSYCATDAGITVNSAADPGNGVCTATECTLREAIALANTVPGQNTIAFNIPGQGPHTIQPIGDLPNITDRVFIDGYTQPGAQPNTAPMHEAINAVLMIEIDGSRANNGFTFAFNGLDSMIRGLVINRFRSAAISESRRTVVTGNFIGTDPLGIVALGNGIGIQSGGGIGGTTPRIGGTTAADRNLIAGNHTGVSIGALSFATVEGNFIGTDRSGQRALGNGIGVVASSCPGCELGRITLGNNLISGNETGARAYYMCCAIGGNLIGVDRTGQLPLPNTGNGLSVSSYDLTVGGNLLAYNGGNGIQVIDSGGANVVTLTGNRIFANGAAGITVTSSRARARLTANTIYNNGALGIDLGDDGVTPNDQGDGDSGPNLGQNYPVLKLAGSDNGNSVINGTINSTPNRPLTLEFFANQQCDPSGYGEGERYLATQAVTTDAGGNAAFTIQLPQAIPLGQGVTATATDGINRAESGNPTSEFSRCRSVAGLINHYLQATTTTTRYNPAPVPGAPAGVFTIEATFVNRSATALTNLFFKVQRLSNNNLLLNAEGGPGGVGALRMGPETLSPGATFSITFQIGLQARAPFTFLVDGYGLPAAGSVGADAPAAALGFTYVATTDEIAVEAERGHVIYLPLLSR